MCAVHRRSHHTHTSIFGLKYINDKQLYYQHTIPNTLPQCCRWNNTQPRLILYISWLCWFFCEKLFFFLLLVVCVWGRCGKLPRIFHFWHLCAWCQSKYARLCTLYFFCSVLWWKKMVTFFTGVGWIYMFWRGGWGQSTRHRKHFISLKNMREFMRLYLLYFR